MFRAIICDIQGVLVNFDEKEYINRDLVDFLMKNKKNYGKLILYSNLSGKKVMDFKKIIPKFFDIVDGEYHASNIEYIKPSVKGFKKILEDWNLKPEEVIFLDDSWSNINAAEKIGVKAIHYTQKEDFSILKSLLCP